MDFKNFTKDFFATFPLFEGKFSKTIFLDFLEKYFPTSDRLDLIEKMEIDLDFFRKNDPASTFYSNDQILSVRRGMLAILAHRIFHKILENNPDISTKFEVEVLAKSVQSGTNIEIHPGATVGRAFAIDHGHGTIIGETTIVGEQVFLYHGVTLGATGKKSKKNRRHPKIGNSIFLGNGAQILGPSILGNHISIGSEAMVLDSILGDDVVVSPGVSISKVKIPDGFKIFGFDAFSKKFVGRKPSSEKKVEVFNLEKVEIIDYD